MKKIDFRSLMPNLITLAGLCFGLSSIRFALEAQFETAVVFIIFAAICDVLDGLVARILNSQSELGAELDSLADFVNFGVAPGLLLYMSIMQERDFVGSIAVLIFILFSCIRLAIFNLDSEDKDTDETGFFMGIPTPVGAVLILLPLTHTFIGFDWALENINLVALYTVLIGALLISRVPTYSSKREKLKLKKSNYGMYLIIFTIILLGLINFLWISLTILSTLYLLSIPFSLRAWKNLKS